MANQDVLRRVEAIVDGYDCRRESLIAIMQDIQNEYKYLSTEALELVAQKLGIGVAKVYSVATFYENFSLEAKGKYIVKVCCGTACHVRKSQPIYDGLREYLALSGKQKTSADGLFTLETVACLGACGLSPVMTVNDEVYPKMTPESAISLLESLRAKEGQDHAEA
jgi:NADH-quinone oxidoreductase subunit E